MKNLNSFFLTRGGNIPGVSGKALKVLYLLSRYARTHISTNQYICIIDDFSNINSKYFTNHVVLPEHIN